MTTNLEHMLGNATETEARLERAMKALGVRFANLDLLELALVHRSHLNERGIEGSDSVTESNERLEFLGDALLGFFSAEYVYRHYPDQPEGVLTVSPRLAGTHRDAGRVGRGFGLHELRLHGAWRVWPGRRGAPDRMLAGAFEAVLGALYLDRASSGARDFMRR